MKQEIAREHSPGTVNIRVSRLPFSEIPHQSRLFIEFQSDPTSLKRFYPNVSASPAGIKSYIPTVLANYHTDRSKLADALIEINSKIGAGTKTFDNIERLRDPDTVAVVTGQQAGLFTGPLYTVYKALSAVKLAETLNRGGNRAVSVFWTATEDHDFEEVSETFFVGKCGRLARSTYEPEAAILHAAVGTIVIEEGIESSIDKLFEDLPATEFSDDIRHLIVRAWSSGELFGDAFAKTLASILSRYGIIFIDPLNAGIKRLSAPIYDAAIKNVDELVANVVQRSSDLVNAGYHAQVLVEDDYFPLFWHGDNGKRTSLRKSGEGKYRAKASDREFTVNELREIAMSEPSRLSPGVMLRPVVQDHLLPTACYFGGGAEIAYFAQNSEVYRALGRPVTPILHRQSFTVVEAKHRRVLEKFDLDLLSLFDGLDATVLKLAEDHLPPETAKIFADVEDKINLEMNRIDHAVSKIDITLAENLAKRRRKINYHIAAIRKKTLLAQARKDETASRQLESLFAAVLPKDALQERSLNVFSFLNKFGLNFIDWIYEAIDLDDKDHRIIDL